MSNSKTLRKKLKDQVHNEARKEEENRKCAEDFASKTMKDWNSKNGFPFLFPDSVMNSEEGRCMADKINRRKEANFKQALDA